jgi:NRAMP (natural resistance-associated macrophage protein)-like metal ion transporter
MGPGIITSAVDNDAGGIATYSVAGAHFGYSLLWILPLIAVALIIVQEMGARMGVVTGKGLSDLIRENFGLKITILIMLALLATNAGNTIAEFAGVAASSEIFGISRYIAVPLAAIFVWIVVVKGTYRSVEKMFLLASAFYVTYVISGILAGPNWGLAAQNMVTPTLQLNGAYLLMIVGIIGTTIAPWMQFYLQASVAEKRIRLKYYRYSIWDVVAGSIVTCIVAFFIIIACAATLYVAGIHINDAADAAIALQPLAGSFASQLFAFGLLNASIFAAAILPLATAYFVCEAFGWEKGINKKFSQAPRFYWLYTGLIILGAAIVLVPGIPLLSVLILSQVLNGVLLPFIMVFMLILINDGDIMGKRVNGRKYNILAWAVSIAIIILTALMLLEIFIPGLI